MTQTKYERTCFHLLCVSNHLSSKIGVKISDFARLKIPPLCVVVLQCLKYIWRIYCEIFPRMLLQICILFQR